MTQKPRQRPGYGREGGFLAMLDKISLALVIIGAINWALIGIFQFDLVAYLFGGQAAVVSRIVYTLVGAAGLWCISLLFGERVSVPGPPWRRKSARCPACCPG